MLKISEVLAQRKEIYEAAKRKAYYVELGLFQKWLEAWGDPNQPAEIYEGIGELHSRASQVIARLQSRIDAFEEAIQTTKLLEDYKAAKHKTIIFDCRHGLEKK